MFESNREEKGKLEHETICNRQKKNAQKYVKWNQFKWPSNGPASVKAMTGHGKLQRKKIEKMVKELWEKSYIRSSVKKKYGKIKHKQNSGNEP